MLQRLFLALVLFAVPAFGQDPPTASKPARPKPIQDNSFLIEEAYNQETGVVQHISTFLRSRGGDWDYSFTQEWPVPTQKHQFSFTIPVASIRNDVIRSQGIGDAALNYRYQLVGSGEDRVAVAPRASILLPTGDERAGLGAGTVGFQFNLPISVELSERIVAHSNAGSTITRSSFNDQNRRTNLTDFNLGQSFIWLASPRFNVMLETLWLNEEVMFDPGLPTRRENTVLISPGIRWAYNFKNGLQIVPGVAVPLGVGPSRGERGIFLYLSFEHPFRRN